MNNKKIGANVTSLPVNDYRTLPPDIYASKFPTDMSNIKEYNSFFGTFSTKYLQENGWEYYEASECKKWEKIELSNLYYIDGVYVYNDSPTDIIVCSINGEKIRCSNNKSFGDRYDFYLRGYVYLIRYVCVDIKFKAGNNRYKEFVPPILARDEETKDASFIFYPPQQNLRTMIKRIPLSKFNNKDKLYHVLNGVCEPKLTLFCNSTEDNIENFHYLDKYIEVEELMENDNPKFKDYLNEQGQIFLKLQSGGKLAEAFAYCYTDSNFLNIPIDKTFNGKENKSLKIIYNNPLSDKPKIIFDADPNDLDVFLKNPYGQHKIKNLIKHDYYNEYEEITLSINYNQILSDFNKQFEERKSKVVNFEKITEECNYYKKETNQLSKRVEDNEKIIKSLKEKLSIIESGESAYEEFERKRYYENKLETEKLKQEIENMKQERIKEKEEELRKKEEAKLKQEEVKSKKVMALMGITKAIVSVVLPVLSIALALIKLKK
jgi:hypothetical protein